MKIYNKGSLCILTTMTNIKFDNYQKNWSKWPHIGPNLGKFSKLRSILPLSLKIYNKGNKIIIIKFDVCHRCQDTELPLVVNFQAKGKILLNLENLPKFAQIWSNTTSFLPQFLIIIKFDVCYRCQDTKLPLVVKFQAKGVNTSQFKKITQIWFTMT